MTERRGRVLGFSAIEAADFKRWLQDELRAARRERTDRVPDSAFVRITSLLNLAKSPNDYEARAAKRKAEALMDRYDLNLSDIDHWRRTR